MLKRIPLVVCETTGSWAAALRRELTGEMTLVETRNLAEVWQQLNASPVAVLALELTTERAERLLTALLRLEQEFPRVVTLVLADRKLFDWENVIREAGAVHFITSPRRLAEVAQLVRRRQAAAIEDAASDQNMPLEERILASLPWGE